MTDLERQIDAIEHRIETANDAEANNLKREKLKPLLELKQRREHNRESGDALRRLFGGFRFGGTR